MKTVFHPHSILVLCEGNHCRSPIAEGLFRAELHSAGINVESAGLGAPEGLPPHAEAIRLMAGRGIDISGLRSRRATADMALAADLILVMDAEQKRWCGDLAPSSRGRIFLLGSWLPHDQREIPDPFRKDPEVFEKAFDQLQRSVAAWMRHLRPAKKTI